jgi:hypothetical protein
MKSPFRLLYDLFGARFLENDLIAPDGGFDTNVYQVLGMVATPGLLISMYALPALISLSTMPPGPNVDWILRIQRMFFPAYSFAVVGFATIFEWDMLFPDRRDFMILAHFPIRLRDLFSAKFAALGMFLVSLVVAVNLIPAMLMPVFSLLVPKMQSVGGLRIFAAQIIAPVSASAFAFFAVASVQGLLINLTSPRIFRRISPVVQMFGMSLMVLSLFLLPLYSMLLRPMAEQHPERLKLFPPFWYTGLYDLITPHGDALFSELGVFGFQALGVAVALFCLAWGLGFRRHYQRTIESEDTSSRAPSRIRAERLIRKPEERAIFAFTGWTLARSLNHRLFLATYLSAGLSFALLNALAVRGEKLAVSTDGLRAVPFLLVFFVVTGFRAAFQFPAELASNWLFRITEARWGETSRVATRKRVLTNGLLPAMLLLLPLETMSWGKMPGAFHIVFQLVCGTLLIEVFFYAFGKVPFTCSWFPGGVNLGVLAALYLYGVMGYSYRLSDLEKALEIRPDRTVLFFAAAGIALVLLWRRHPKAAAVSFDASEPHIQTLDLS